MTSASTGVVVYLRYVLVERVETVTLPKLTWKAFIKVAKSRFNLERLKRAWLVIDKRTTKALNAENFGNEVSSECYIICSDLEPSVSSFNKDPDNSVLLAIKIGTSNTLEPFFIGTSSSWFIVLMDRLRTRFSLPASTVLVRLDGSLVFGHDIGLLQQGEILIAHAIGSTLWPIVTCSRYDNCGCQACAENKTEKIKVHVIRRMPTKPTLTLGWIWHARKRTPLWNNFMLTSTKQMKGYLRKIYLRTNRIFVRVDSCDSPGKRELFLIDPEVDIGSNTPLGRALGNYLHPDALFAYLVSLPAGHIVKITYNTSTKFIYNVARH